MSRAITTFREYLLILRMKENGLGDSHSGVDVVLGIN
jgi:hypothetical protein